MNDVRVENDKLYIKLPEKDLFSQVNNIPQYKSFFESVANKNEIVFDSGVL